MKLKRYVLIEKDGKLHQRQTFYKSRKNAQKSKQRWIQDWINCKKETKTHFQNTSERELNEIVGSVGVPQTRREWYKEQFEILDEIIEDMKLLKIKKAAITIS